MLIKNFSRQNDTERKKEKVSIFIFHYMNTKDIYRIDIGYHRTDNGYRGTDRYHRTDNGYHRTDNGYHKTDNGYHIELITIIERITDIRE